MAIEIRTVQVTVPAGSLSTAPYTQQVTFPARVVTQINVKVPPGPRGQLGFALGTSGMPVIPVGPGNWIITDDEEISFPLVGYWDSGSWEVFAYNMGNYNHTLYLTFLLDLVTIQQSAPTPIEAATLSNLTLPVGT